MAEEEKQNPGLTGSIPPVVAPFGGAAAAAGGEGDGNAAAAKPAPTIRLKPVIRRPMIRKPGTTTTTTAAPAAPAPAPAPAQVAKSATGALKGVTGPIPAQAVLKKTGIIAEGGVAEGILTSAQAQAAKSKTSRISLEAAIGVAPVASSPAPMKTIRLRRPTDIRPAPPKIVTPAAQPAAVPSEPVAEDLPTVPTMEPVPLSEAPTAVATDSTVTQKKTLKLHRPSAALKRPAMNVGAAPTPSTADTVPDIADIPDIPTVASFDAMKASAAASQKKSAAAGIFAAVTSVAAVAALALMGFCTFKLYTEATGAGAVANGIVSAVGY